MNLHTLFGPTITADFQTARELIFKDAIASKTRNVINMLSQNNIDPANPSLVDGMDQNLLHIAVRTKNYDLAKYLMEKKVNVKKQCVLSNETPYDIAIKNHDKKMIEILLNQEKFDLYKVENDRLTRTTYDMEQNNKILTDANKDLTIANSLLKVQLGIANTQLDEEKQNNKRKFEEYDNCFRENKRLKIEVTKAQVNNMALQSTITSLRDSMKKK